MASSLGVSHMELQYKPRQTLCDRRYYLGHYSQGLYLVYLNFSYYGRRLNNRGQQHSESLVQSPAPAEISDALFLKATLEYCFYSLDNLRNIRKSALSMLSKHSLS